MRNFCTECENCKYRNKRKMMQCVRLCPKNIPIRMLEYIEKVNNCFDNCMQVKEEDNEAIH